MSPHYFFLYCRPTDNTANLHLLKRTYCAVNFNNEWMINDLSPIIIKLKVKNIGNNSLCCLFHDILILIK